MRLLLTSGGPRNEVLVDALADLLAKPFADAKVVVVITASVAMSGDKRWLLDDFDRLRTMGFGEIDIVDLPSLPRDAVEERLRGADVVFVEGGNRFHLARGIVDGDLVGLFREVLDTKVYVGASAGSMIFGRDFGSDLGAEESREVAPPLCLFDWYIKPHWLAPTGPEFDEAWADKLAVDFPVYLLDDESAVRVRGDRVDVVSGGRWRYIAPTDPS